MTINFWRNIQNKNYSLKSIWLDIVKQQNHLLFCTFKIFISFNIFISTNIINVDSEFNDIFLEGKCIAVRLYFEYFMNLYLWNDEFYEVYFDIDSNKIIKIEKLFDEKKLNMYIDYMIQINKHEKA